MFSRAEVERVASRYIFGPEMIRRSVFGQGAQLNRWLKSVGVLPVATLRGKNAKMYDRVQFDSVLHLQPKPLDEVVIQPRQKYRIPQKDKEQAIAAVRSGLTPHHVGQRMGVNPTTVARWVKEFEASGRIQPAGKLDPYADAIVVMIEASPTHSTYRLHVQFMEREKVKVGYTRFAQFIVELGFSRDPATNRLQRSA